MHWVDINQPYSTLPESWKAKNRVYAEPVAAKLHNIETTPEIQKTAQILEISHILGHVFKHSDEEDARQTFKEMDLDGNGTIDLDELLAHLYKSGFSRRELKDLKSRVSTLYAEGFELDFECFIKIVCPHAALDLGELLISVLFRQESDGHGELSITVQNAIGLLAMDDGGTSDPYVLVKVDQIEQKTSVKLETLNPKWEENFSFAIKSMESEVTLEMWDEDIGKRDDFMGELRLGTISQMRTHYGKELQSGVHLRRPLLPSGHTHV